MSAAVENRLSCAEVEDLLPLVADGVLGPEDEPALFEHLAGCQHCQQALLAHDLVGLALSTQPPLPAEPRVLHYRLPLPVALLAAALLASVLGLWIRHAAAAETTASTVSPVAATRTELIRIEPGADGGAGPIYHLRVHGPDGVRELAIAHEALDGGGQAERGDPLMPVGLNR